jgi:hypothetical protein
MQDEPDSVAHAERKADEVKRFDEWEPDCRPGDAGIADVMSGQETRISRREIDREMAETAGRPRGANRPAAGAQLQ